MQATPLPDQVIARVPHHRAPRHWPPLRTDPIVLPYPSPPNQPPATALLVTVASLLGIGLSVTVLGRGGASGASGGLGIGVLALSGTTALASIAVYFIQRRTAARETAQLLALYTRELDHLEGRPSVGSPLPADAVTGMQEPGLLQFASDEIEARRANDPPLLAPDRNDPARPPFIQQAHERPGLLWQRRPSDPDFLVVRAGVGRVRPRFEVRLADQGNALTLPAKNKAFRAAHDRARTLVQKYQALDDVPITIPLREHASVVVLAGPANKGTVRALIAQAVLHHSPREVHPFVLSTPESVAEWRWALGLAPDAALPTLAWGSATERDTALGAIQAELLRRDQIVSDRSHDAEREPLLPHLLMVVDAIAPEGSALLASPAIEMALLRGKELGATVISMHTDFDQAPSQATLALDCIAQAVVPLWPDPPPPTACQSLDTLSVPECQHVTQLTSRFAPEEHAEERLPSQVGLYDLFVPAAAPADTYPIEQMWERGRQENAAMREQMRVPSCAIPIGRTSGGTPLELDFVKDGPHGLLIGQTGSGKSELLRSIIAGLAIKYPPDQVNFVLVDYKGGLGLDVFDRLPHSLALLTNMAQAGQTLRFLTMLEAEMRDRQEKRKRGEEFPRLFVIIDEFAEMVAYRGGPSDASDVILASLLRILRLGRALDVHLLFASQRPEGSAMQKLHGYVQYRISLRTNTEEDSREVIGRPDAARLPVEVPGRGYLLRGDYDLQLFQAARAALPFRPPDPATGKLPVTADEEITARMSKLPSTYQVKRWPKSLPAPGTFSPTPLILVISGPGKRVEDAWNAARRQDLSRTPLVAPLGLIDRPTQQLREWFLADLHGYESRLTGGPLLVTGDLNSGKTTTLQTLMLYFALQHGPSQLRWYVLDPTAALTDFAALPQARDYVEQGQVNVIDGLNEDQFKAFKARFERAMQVPPSSGPGGRPPLLLVIDDYDELSAQYRDKQQLHKLAEQVIRNREREVYLAISASKQSYDNLPQLLLNAMATKIALYMSNQDNLATMLGRRLPFVPDPLPGRGFVQTRTSLDEIQIAAPVYGANDAERLEALQRVLAGPREGIGR